MLLLAAQWFYVNYDKIWVYVIISSFILVILGLLLKSDIIMGFGEDLTDFYDEILSE